MKLFWKILIGIFISGFLGLLVFTYMISSFGSEDMCDNKIIKTEYSPNKKYKIVTFCRECGATTDFSTQISILEFEEELKNESGNLFSADSEHGKAQTNEENIINVIPKWLSNEKVIIEYDKNARVFKNENSINEIMIDYKKITTANSRQAPAQNLTSQQNQIEKK